MELELDKYQEQIGLYFQDKSLLLRALTHPSYLNENPAIGPEDNQRLEFLGDAVLDFISGELLYHRFPEAPEGRLTRLRASLVRTETLADLALQCHLDQAILLGKGEFENHGRERISNLCAAFEALMGALYLDQGLEPVSEFVTPYFEEALKKVLNHELDKDPKSLLQEWCQRHLNVTPIYKTVGAEGPDHEKIFTVAVIVDEEYYAEGRGKSKRIAAQKAAATALKQVTDFMRDGA